MKTKLIILSFIFISSCTGLKIPKKNRLPINKDFSAYVQTEPYLTKNGGKHNRLTSLLQIPYNRHDSVKIQFISNNRLQISFSDNVSSPYEAMYKKHYVFEGKFKKRGFYEVYTQKKRLEIPPILPIFYSSVQINRVRIARTADGNLIIDNKYVNNGNIFLFAAGVHIRTQCFFKILH